MTGILPGFRIVSQAGERCEADNLGINLVALVADELPVGRADPRRRAERLGDLGSDHLRGGAQPRPRQLRRAAMDVAVAAVDQGHQALVAAAERDRQTIAAARGRVHELELDDAGVGAGEAWVPHVAAGVPFRFHVVGTDKGEPLPHLIEKAVSSLRGS